MTMRSAMTGTEGNDADPKVAYGINPAESGMMIGTNPPAEETAQTLRKSPGGENGVIQMNRQNEAIERDYKEKIHLRKAMLCSHRCEECRFCQDCGDEDGGEYVWCRHPNTQSLPDFFNIMEENMVCDLFEPCANAETIGFKAGQSKDGGLGDEREVSPTLSHKPSALEPTVAQSGVRCLNPQDQQTGRVYDPSGAMTSLQAGGGVSGMRRESVLMADNLAAMRYIVRRLTPTEAERLMGLPDGYTIPAGLDPNDPALVAEFQRIFDTFGAIMAEYEHKTPPKPKSANQVRAWLEKITDTCPDSPRYKACGNGWATNQPRWILTRLLAIGEGIDPFTGEEL